MYVLLNVGVKAHFSSWLPPIPIGIFYFLLGNLPPWMRSKINSVQLVMLVKKTLIDKYTMQSVLKPIVEDLKKLVSCDSTFAKVKKSPSTAHNCVYLVLTGNGTRACSPQRELCSRGSCYIRHNFCRIC